MRMRGHYDSSIASKPESARSKSPLRSSEAREFHRNAGDIQFMLSRRIIQAQEFCFPAALAGQAHKHGRGVPSGELHAASRNQIREKSDDHRPARSRHSLDPLVTRPNTPATTRTILAPTSRTNLSLHRDC